MPDFNDQGCIHNPAFVEEVVSQMTNPFFASAAPSAAGSGKNKLILLHENYKKLKIPHPKPLQTTVGDCVSHACATALDYLCVTEIANGEREKWIARTASEFIYSNGRVIIGKGRLGSGDGSLNAWTLKAMQELGTLIRQRYSKVDLTEYSPSRARTWGNTKVPTTLLDISKDYFITGYKLIKSFDEAMDALASNCPIVVASNQGFTKKRDKDGFCSPSGSWSHSMAVIGGDSTGKRPGVAILNSWPGYLSGPNPYQLPESAFMCDAHVFDRMAKSYGDTFALFGFNGYKLQIDTEVWK